MRQDTAEGNCCSDQRVQLFVASDRKLEMAGCNPLDLEVLGGVSGQFKNFGGQILEDSGDIDSGCVVGS